MIFDVNYEGRPRTKRSVKSFISDFLYEQASEIIYFGMVGVIRASATPSTSRFTFIRTE